MTVLANSARLALELNAPGLSVFLIGGEYRPDRMDTVGPHGDEHVCIRCAAMWPSLARTG